MEVVLKKLKTKTETNRKATIQVSFWYGSREGGFQVQKAHAATVAGAFSLQSLLPPDVEEKSWTCPRNVSEAGG